MGAPTSSIFSEVFLQHIESTAVFEILVQNRIIGHFRYVDDILIVYNDSITNMHDVFDSFNNLTHNINFTMEKETDNSINFLDVTIRKEHDTLTFNIYRKPTTTDSIIPRDSCHPQEHKHAAIRHLINGMNTYNLNAANKDEEKHIIEHIISENKYDISLIEKLAKTKNNEKQPPRTKWAKFTYVVKETKFITKLFKDSPIKVTFTTRNTIKKLLSTKPRPVQEQFDSSGVYHLSCPDCHVKYVGQTGRSFRIRFPGHFRDYKYNTNKSKFAQHLLDNKHSIGPIEDIMKVLYKKNKGKLMDTMERYFIYKETYMNNQINDKNTVKPNIIFKTLVHENTSRARTAE